MLSSCYILGLRINKANFCQSSFPMEVMIYLGQEGLPSLSALVYLLDYFYRNDGTPELMAMAELWVTEVTKITQDTSFFGNSQSKQENIKYKLSWDKVKFRHVPEVSRTSCQQPISSVGATHLSISHLLQVNSFMWRAATVASYLISVPLIICKQNLSNNIIIYFL